MSQPTGLELIKAVRRGNLSEVIALLDAGATPELQDDKISPGLPLSIACFMGYTDIVRELIARGAKVNLPDNATPSSPLAMALQGKRTEVLKVLLENGLVVPPGVNLGLSEEEMMFARFKGQQGSLAPDENFGSGLEIEEISMVSCFGTDTNVLEADIVRAARAMAAKNENKK